MQKMKEAASEFLAKKRVAVTSVSRNPQGHGSNVVYQRLRQRGYQVFAVDPNADTIEGDPCYHDLQSIPVGVDWVVIGTRPETAEATMRECVDLGIHRVWMHRGPGAGSVSEAATEYGRQHGIKVIDGALPHQNLTLYSLRNTLSADQCHIFNRPTPALLSLANKTGSSYNALQGSDSC